MVYDAYNLTQINSSDIVLFTQGVDQTLMNGSFGVLLLITIMTIMFLSIQARTNNFKKAFGFSSLFGAVLVVLLRNMLLVSDNAVLIVWIIAAIGGAIAFLVKD